MYPFSLKTFLSLLLLTEKGPSYEVYIVPGIQMIYVFMLLYTEACLWTRCAHNVFYIVQIYTLMVLAALSAV